MAGDECKLSIFNYLECDSTNPLAEQEIKGLEALEYEMSRNVQSMRRKRQSAAFSETLQGRIYQLCGKAFAVYCYIRFVGVKQGKLLLAFLLADYLPLQATISVFLPISSSSSTNYPDLLSQLAVYVLTKLSGNVDAERIGSVARQISLLLVGVVIVISIRLVLRNVTRVSPCQSWIHILTYVLLCRHCESQAIISGRP